MMMVVVVVTGFLVSLEEHTGHPRLSNLSHTHEKHKKNGLIN